LQKSTAPLSGAFRRIKMMNYLFDENELTNCANEKNALAGLCSSAKAAWCALAMLAFVAGCQTAPPHSAPPPASSSAPPQQAASAGAATTESTNSNTSLVLQEGDTIKISFAGAPNLDTIQSVRRDGKITLQMIGEYDAAGKTPATVEADLKKLYGPQLVNSEVSVTVQSSAFVVYIMGAVLKPGKLVSDRPLTPLQALIEAGIDDTRANLKAVQIIRTDSNGHTQKTKLNLYNVIHHPNEQMPDFTLKPYDVINVPQKFNFY
jgi:polysaccharide export outer membrane protein